MFGDTANPYEDNNRRGKISSFFRRLFGLDRNRNNENASNQDSQNQESEIQQVQSQNEQNQQVQNQQAQNQQVQNQQPQNQQAQNQLNENKQNEDKNKAQQNQLTTDQQNQQNQEQQNQQTPEPQNQQTPEQQNQQTPEQQNQNQLNENKQNANQNQQNKNQQNENKQIQNNQNQSNQNELNKINENGNNPMENGAPEGPNVKEEINEDLKEGNNIIPEQYRFTNEQFKKDFVNLVKSFWNPKNFSVNEEFAQNNLKDKKEVEEILFSLTKLDEVKPERIIQLVKRDFGLDNSKRESTNQEKIVQKLFYISYISNELISTLLGSIQQNGFSYQSISNFYYTVSKSYNDAILGFLDIKDEIEKEKDDSNDEEEPAPNYG